MNTMISFLEFLGLNEEKWFMFWMGGLGMGLPHVMIAAHNGYRWPAIGAFFGWCMAVPIGIYIARRIKP